MHPEQLREIVESLGRPRILVIGDLILDRYVTGAVERISPEAPIPVLSATQSEDRLGGAGNVAANLRAMEAPVEVVGVVGDDVRGRQMLGMFEELGCDASGCIADADRPTTEKTRMISGVQQMLRSIPPELGDSAPLIIRIRVDLPAPLRPRMPTRSP